MVNIEKIGKEIQKEFVAKMKYQALIDLLTKKEVITEQEIENSFVDCAEDLEDHHDCGDLVKLIEEYHNQ